MSANILSFPQRPSRLSRRLEWFATDRSVLLAIWAVYFVLRVAVLMIDVSPTSDAAWYDLRAIALAHGQGYLDTSGQPTAFWPPGWPMALSFVYAQFGASVVALGLFNLASAMGIGAFTLALGRRLFGSEGGARAGLLLLAVYPNAIAYVPLALTEVFYTALLMAGCWVLISRQSRLHLVTAGIIFGLATLVKAQTLIVIPLIFAIDWLRMRGIWRRLPRLLGEGLLVLGIAVLTVLPWTVRNHQVLGEWVFVSTNGGHTLLTGNHDGANGDYSPDTPAVRALAAQRGLTETQRDREARRLGLAWIKAHPATFLTLAPRKLARLWLPDGEAEWAYQAGAPSYPRFALAYRAVRVINQAYYSALMLGFAAAFLAMPLLRRRDGQRWFGWWLLPYAVALYPSLIAIAFSGQSRFHYPVMPWVCMATGWLAVRALGAWSARRRA